MDSAVYLFSKMNPFYIILFSILHIFNIMQAALRNKAIFIYKGRVAGIGSANVSEKSKANLRQKYSADGLSETAKKDIRRRVDNWGWAVRSSQQLWSKGRERRRRYFVLVTLTLPAVQIESDNVIKRRYLNVWLQNLERVHKGINWLWVAESQKNGNLHFHVVVDRWVSFEWVRRSWNRVLSNGDYIDRFQAKFGHRCAPSVNVKGQKAMGNPGAYITKYLTGEKFARPLQGRKWGCCDKLREIDRWALNRGEELESEIVSKWAGELADVRYGEFSTAYYFKSPLWRNGVFDTLTDRWLLYICHTLGRFYPELIDCIPEDLPT